LAEELELKALVQDPVMLRRRLQAVAGRLTYRGMMRDRRLDRDGVLASQDRLLRVRIFESAGVKRAVVTWKGPPRRSPEGYKLREELEYSAEDGGAAIELFRALGYHVTHAIDRHVEIFEVAGATARIEWYPRMDLLLEVEGSPAAIEDAIAATGIPRTEFRADSLQEFFARYQSRTGQPAILAETDLAGILPPWTVV
jgi:adenylate cyclase class IV